MSKQILTIEDLVHFCKTQKIKRFDANESGKQICVKVNDIATFEEEVKSLVGEEYTFLEKGVFYAFFKNFCSDCIGLRRILCRCVCCGKLRMGKCSL